MTKLLSGLFQGNIDGKGAEPKRDLPIPTPERLEGPQILWDGGAPIQQKPVPAPPILAQPTTPTPEILPEKAGFDWKKRMLGGLQSMQAAQSMQPQAPVQPMDMDAIKQLTFAHRQGGGIIPPRGRY